MAKPTEIPEWATDPGAAVITPSLAKRALGWIVELPPHEFFNWLANRTGQWLSWTDRQFEDTPSADGEAAWTAGTGGGFEVTTDNPGVEHRITHFAAGGGERVLDTQTVEADTATISGAVTCATANASGAVRTPLVGVGTGSTAETRLDTEFNLGRPQLRIRTQLGGAAAATAAHIQLADNAPVDTSFNPLVTNQCLGNMLKVAGGYEWDGSAWNRITGSYNLEATATINALAGTDSLTFRTEEQIAITGTSWSVTAVTPSGDSTVLDFVGMQDIFQVTGPPARTGVAVQFARLTLATGLWAATDAGSMPNGTRLYIQAT